MGHKPRTNGRTSRIQFFSACINLRKRAHLEKHRVGIAAVEHRRLPNLAQRTRSDPVTGPVVLGLVHEH